MYPPLGRKGSVDGQSVASSTTRDGSFLRHSQLLAPQKPRRGSTASSAHSVGGSLDTSSGWANTAPTVFEAGQNAISTLLKPPIVRTGLQPHTSAPVSSTHRPPTARDIPPVTLTGIPRIDASEFKPYLSQVGALYEQLQRVKENDDDGGVPTGRRGSRQGESGEAQDDSHLKPVARMPIRRKSSTASVASISSLEVPIPVRRLSSGQMRKAALGPPPLSTIPHVYFEEDFHLENPRTFDVVSERSEVVRPSQAEGSETKAAANGSVSAPRKALATNAILQEKLSWYMDTVEMHLINSISHASTTFFSALGSLRELHSEAADSVEQIKALRSDLRALDEEIATAGLGIMQERRRLANMQQLSSAVQQLRRIVDGVVKCEAMVDAGDVETALDAIDSIEKLIGGAIDVPGGGEIPSTTDIPPLDLRGASALTGVGGDLDTLRFRIGKVYESKFQDRLLGDLRGHIDSLVLNEILMRWSNAAQRSRGGTPRLLATTSPSYMKSTDELKVAISPCILSLHRARHTTVAATAYRDSVLREIKSLIRKPLPSSNDDDNESVVSVSTTSGGGRMTNQEKSTILARNLRSLSPEDAEEMLSSMYVRFTETMRRLTIQVKVLLDAASSFAAGGTVGQPGLKSPPIQSPMTSPSPDRPAGGEFGLEIQEELHLVFDLSNLVGQAVDLAHDKILKILRVRSEQTKALPLVRFLRYYTLNLLFVNECEAISGRSGTAFKTLVTGHIKDFVQAHGESENRKLAQGMESDQWGARDFTDADTALLADIMSCSTKDPEGWTGLCAVWQSRTGEEGADGQVEPMVEPTTGGEKKDKDKVRPANMGSESFLLPRSAILCLGGMTGFLQLIAGIPLLTADIATTLVAYLQLFNSRCTQLILGAGATRSAGLKNITTKHLALASQALAFVAGLIPHIREFVRRQVSTGAPTGAGSAPAAVSEFDKIRRLLQEHQESIFQKLVDIMRNRAGAAAKEMRKINWDTVGGTSVHVYVETLSKDTTVLHRVLNKHLPESSVQMVMVPVFASYREQFGRALGEATVVSEVGRDSMIRDVEYIISKIGKISGFNDTGERLLKTIRAKEVGGDKGGNDKGGNDRDDKRDDSGDSNGVNGSSTVEGDNLTRRSTDDGNKGSEGGEESRSRD